jgi:putative transposase
MPDLTEFPDAARRHALERYRKLQPHLEQDVPLLQVARDAALPIRTARRWTQSYRRFRLAGYRANSQ